MSAVKFPKIAFSVTAAEIVSADWRGQPPTEHLTRDEKREVIRRANAYPKLIEVLLECELTAQATQLLRELGEIE